MARLPKYVNQNFFNEDNESKAMWYVLGSFYAGYHSRSSTKRSAGISFTSKHEGLVQIVKDQLESEHTIVKRETDTSNGQGKNYSYSLEIYVAPDLYARIGELGLNVDKKERKFPKNIPDQYIGHFVRGFLDGQSNMAPHNKKCTQMEVHMNKDFLTDLNKVLEKQVGVKRKEPTNNVITYGHADCLKIHDFIYKDWKFIEKSGLYLPSKKEMFKTDHVIVRPDSITVINSRKKMELAKGMLNGGIPTKEIANKLGYCSPTSFHGTFTNIVGMTPNQWVRQNKSQSLS